MWQPPETDQVANSWQPPEEDRAMPAKYGMKDAIGDVARPLFEGGGAAVGGILGAGLGPIGAVGGGALGFGTGKAAADLLDRGLGRRPMLQNVPQAISETGNNILQGGEAEATGQLAGKAIPPLLKGAGKLGAQLGEWATAIPEKDFRSVAENPSSILPGRLEKAGQKFGEAAKNVGISDEITPETVDRMRSPGQYAFDTFNKLKTSGKITPQEALQARQSLDAVYPVPNQKNASYIRMLDQIRSSFQDVITNASPELQSASKDYAVAKSGSKFQSLFPQTKSGKPAYFRTGALLAGLASDEPGAMFGFPVPAGITTAAVGGAGSVAKKLFSDSTATRGIVGSAAGKLFSSQPMHQAGVVNSSNQMQQPFQGQQNAAPENQVTENGANEGFDHNGIVTPTKTLTGEIARKFLSLANNSKELARELAKKAGYSW